MLRALHIRDFAIIEELELEFDAGFNVITGETGAGKSIIMQALDLVCGGRASPDAIRAGAEEAVIEAVFDLTPEESRAFEELGIRTGEDLQIRRVVSPGKSRVHINGDAASVGLLTQLGEHLIHVYGQHEQALLLRPESHLDLLDTYAAHPELTTTMAAKFDALDEKIRLLAERRAGQETSRQRAELARFQLQELDAAAFQPGEGETLRQEKERLSHAEKLLQICQQGEEALYSGDEAIITGVGKVAALLRDAARIDPRFGESIELLDAAQAQVQEAAERLRDYGERISFDAERREAVEERWALLQRLIRKYGGSLETLMTTRAALATELSALDDEGVSLASLEAEVKTAADEAWKSASALSASRRRRAKLLEKNIAKELHALGMKGGAFSVSFAGEEPNGKWDAIDPLASNGAGNGAARLTRAGADRAEFHFTANAGEPARPLARVASGGELSRIMLGLKVLTAGRGEVATLVFDEVDAGIGGTIADAVGSRLRQLGDNRQILCITHLPQIAAAAAHHFVVEKRVRQGRTVSAARHLDREERIAELSRMLGGADDSEAARYARRLVATRQDA